MLNEQIDEDEGDELQHFKSVEICSAPSKSLVLSTKYCCTLTGSVDVIKPSEGLELEATSDWFSGSFLDDEPSDDELDDEYIPHDQ